MHKKHLIIRFTLILFSASWLLAACSNDAVDQQPTSIAIGDSLPAIQLLSPSGEIVDSNTLFKNKVVVLNLWATWCPPCRKEMPDLVRLSELLPADKFLVVGLSVDNNLEDVQNYINEMKIPFPMFWDTGGQQIASPILKAFRYPETFVFNSKGVLVEKVTGTFPWASPKMIAVLKDIQRTGNVPAPDKDLSISSADSLKWQTSG